MKTISRRDLLRGAATVGAAAFASSLTGSRKARAASGGDDPRFLIVLCASGGASLLDSVLAIRASECATPSVLNTFADSLITRPDGSPIRAVDMAYTSIGPIPMPFSTSQASFVKKHHEDMMVATCRRTSVSHQIAQSRSVTGHHAWNGRTLQEATALQHGEGFALPNVHLLTGTGFTRRGLDPSVPAWSYGELVADPRFWPLGFDAQRGIPGAPSASVVEAARGLRTRAHALSSRAGSKPTPRTGVWRHLQDDRVRAKEAEAFVDHLLLQKDSAEFPLSQYGYSRSPDAERLEKVFPSMATDPLEMQAAMAFLLLKHRLSVTVTLGLPEDASSTFREPMGMDLMMGGFEMRGKPVPTGGPPPGSGMAGAQPGGGSIGGTDLFTNTPAAFDFSHQAHRGTQAFMWSRLYKVMDGLIGLLKEEEWADGESFWDRSLIYVATDFGRAPQRPKDAPEFGSAHDFESGALVLSPLAAGDRALGGVDPNTGATFGFDRVTGAPDPGSVMQERDLYAGILQALQVDTSGSTLPDMRAMRRSV